jgi:proteasome lid subunit RPN8/RPN11
MIWLRPSQYAALLAHARADAPREACGLLLGRGREVVEVIPIANSASDPVRHFRLNEEAYVAALFAGKRRGLELVGFYHSHPAGIAVPSQTDIAYAHYPDAAQVIIGLAGEPPVQAWWLRYGRAEVCPLHVSDVPPPADESGTRQNTAVFMSVVLSLILLVVAALALLPPAPRVP